MDLLAGYGSENSLSSDESENEAGAAEQVMEPEAPDYSKFKVVELKQVLKEMGLPVTGRKADLIERIQHGALGIVTQASHDEVPSYSSSGEVPIVDPSPQQSEPAGEDFHSSEGDVVESLSNLDLKSEKLPNKGKGVVEAVSKGETSSKLTAPPLPPPPQFHVKQKASNMEIVKVDNILATESPVELTSNIEYDEASKTIVPGESSNKDSAVVAESRLEMSQESETIVNDLEGVLLVEEATRRRKEPLIEISSFVEMDENTVCSSDDYGEYGKLKVICAKSAQLFGRKISDDAIVLGRKVFSTR